MFNKFCITIGIPGALAADYAGKFIAPSNCTLVHVAAACITQDATLKIGTSSDDDAYLESQTIADGSPAEFERDDFVDDQFPSVADGTTVVVTVGHGSNCVNFTAVLTFVEG